MKGMHCVSWVLLVIGGLNWGLVGLGQWFGGNWNVVNLILGSVSWLEGLVYVLVGLSALHLVVTHKKTCKKCESAPSQM
jgi:uncharacterized membrane protein YuzA (DUF378 family)